MSEGSKELHIPTGEDERVKQVRDQAVGLLNQSDLVTIDSNDMYDIANDMLSDVHGKLKELEKKRKAITDPINEGLKAVRELFRPAEEQLEVAKATLKRKMLDYQDKIEQERRAAEAKAVAERQAEIDAAAAAQAQAEAAVDAAVEAGDTEAIAAASDAFVAAEHQVLEAQVATIHVPATAKPSSGGHALGKTYKAEITNLPAFLRYMADQIEAGDTRFDKTIDIKVGQLNLFAKATKGTVPIPGVTYNEERTLAAR